jgi:hypothetical protein
MPTSVAGPGDVERQAVVDQRDGQLVGAIGGVGGREEVGFQQVEDRDLALMLLVARDRRNEASSRVTLCNR